MGQDLPYAAIEHDDELAALGEIAGAAFGTGKEASEDWLGANRAEVRVLRRRRAVVGGLLRIPMGQFFGGRRVAMTGIAGVAVTPSERGTGAATQLMHAVVRELYAEQVALSALYPATLPLYRRSGWELAGSHMRIRVPVRAIDVGDREPALRPMEARDRDAVGRCYRSAAARRSGWLDRGDYIWDRVYRERNGREVYSHVVDGDGIEGYVVHWQKMVEGGGYELMLRDLAATTPRAARRLLAFLADHRSVAPHAMWTGGADDPFLYLLGERDRIEVTLRERWMLRVVDVERALRQRGYPPGIEARVELELADDIIPENAGRIALEVSDGRGCVERVTRGPGLRLDARALASLYAGYATAEQLAGAGAIDGPPEELAQASALFAGPPPACPDFF